MKGYKPNIKLINKKELNSQKQNSFIELGVKESKCETECECEKCKSN